MSPANPIVPGRYNCIGKNLAMLQIHGVVASLLGQFDVAFGPDEDGVSVWRDLKDQFNAHPGELDLIFVPRADSPSAKS